MQILIVVQNTGSIKMVVQAFLRVAPVKHISSTAHDHLHQIAELVDRERRGNEAAVHVRFLANLAIQANHADTCSIILTPPRRCRSRRSLA